MSLFFEDDEKRFTGVRQIGFARYRELLGKNWKGFFAVGFVTLLFFIPFAAGLVYAILSKSTLLALVFSLLGGAMAGPGLACLYDHILRRMRNDQSEWSVAWKRAFKQNWKIAIPTGMVQCGFVGMAVFVGALMIWGATPPSLGTIALVLFGSLLLSALLTVWWPQAVLFTQTPLIRLKNCILFTLYHPGRVLGAAALQVVWWLLMLLLLPWTAFVVPILGVWYITFLSLHIIYRLLNKDFDVEDQIRASFPDNLPEEEYIP
ncbi:MAG: hypothetical protein IKI59_09445 [Clostridia bacterium]|nr:hypothetical protein [Clostridia bacterium]